MIPGSAGYRILRNRAILYLVFGIAVFGRSICVGRGIRSAAAEKNSSGQDDERNNGVRTGSFEFVRFAVKDSETFCAAV